MFISMSTRKFLSVLMLVWVCVAAYCQVPKGPRPPKDDRTYIGSFDIPVPVSDTTTYVYKEADRIPKVKMDSSKLAKLEKKNHVMCSFIVEKDGSISDLQVWITDEPVCASNYKIEYIEEHEDYPGWAKAFVCTDDGSYRNVQVWQSANKLLNEKLDSSLRTLSLTPAEIDGIKVRYRVCLPLK